MSDDIGGRFKAYEACYDFTLPRRLPMVVRVDGRGFHGLDLIKPFDGSFADVMATTARTLCQEIQGSVMAYVQSDEISVIVRDDQTLQTQPWVGKRLNKILSHSASIATRAFNAVQIVGRPCEFDSRAFILPTPTEVFNYLVWRQQDATRNSIQMQARSIYTHKECLGRNSKELVEMCHKAGKRWEDVPTRYRRGVVVYRDEQEVGDTVRRPWKTDCEPPIFDGPWLTAIWLKS